MNYKILLYCFFVLYSVFLLNAVNFSSLIKKNRNIEVKLWIITLSFIMSYVLTNFFLDFLSIK